MLLALLLAAQITTVADAADQRHALELDLDATLLHLRRETRLTREQQGPGGTSFEDELHHLSTTDEIGLRLNIGLYHDVELHVIAPLVLRELQSWRFYDPATSTLANNHLDVSGCADPTLCAPNAPARPIVLAPGQSERRGFRDPTIGLAWGVINEQRELQLGPELFPDGHAFATWVVGFDYTLPLPGPVDDPSHFGAASSLDLGTLPGVGPEAREAHVFTLWTAFSKRFRVLEPYLRVSGSVPVPVKSAAYDNCSHPELLADIAFVNCQRLWKGETGYAPPPSGTLTLGSELVLHEDPYGDSRFAFDARADLTYRGPGRAYTQVTDALGKLTWEDESATLLGAVGLYARVASWLDFRVYGTVGFDTAHFLTDESVGENKDATPGVQLSGGSSKPAPDQNPSYDFRLDQVGRRLRAEASLIWGVSGSMALSF